MTKPKKKRDPHTVVILAELRSLEKSKRSVRRDLQEAVRGFEKQKSALRIAKRNCAGALKRIERRAQILTGRLA